MTNSNSNPKKGIDVSLFQQALDWSTVTDSGYSFVFIKATEGETYVDPTFTKNWEAAQLANLKSAPYHFFRSADDPKKQANFFIQTVSPYGTQFGMPPALDVETEQASISKDQFAQNILEWLSLVQQEFGTVPYLYSGHAFANEYLTDPAFASYPLWIASYDRSSPLIPTAWSSVGYQIWQSGQTTIGSVQVDHNSVNPDLTLS